MMTSKAAKAKGAERKQRMDTCSLMEQILSRDNLNAAYLQVVRNKGAAGIDGMTVEELGDYLSENGEEQSKEPHQTWSTSVVSVENCISTWICQARSLRRCSYSNKQ